MTLALKLGAQEWKEFGHMRKTRMVPDLADMQNHLMEITMYKTFSSFYINIT